MENVAIKIVQKGEAEMTCNIKIVSLGAHDAEPISPIQALEVNPFLSRYINRTVPNQSQQSIDSAIVLHQTTRAQEIQ